MICRHVVVECVAADVHHAHEIADFGLIAVAVKWGYVAGRTRGEVRVAGHSISVGNQVLYLPIKGICRSS